jgi:hypothetical protein
MNINVIKSDNTSEKLDLTKILRWSNWAAENCPDLSLETLVTSVASSFHDGMTTNDITIALCKTCEDLSAISAQQKDYKLTRQYFELSRNLYIPNIIKKANKFHSANIPDSEIIADHFLISPTNAIPLNRYSIKSILQLGINEEMYDSDQQ